MAKKRKIETATPVETVSQYNNAFIAGFIPENRTVDVRPGEKIEIGITFTENSEESRANTVYAWSKGDLEVTDTANVEGQSSATLVIESATVDDTGSYFLTVTTGDVSDIFEFNVSVEADEVEETVNTEETVQDSGASSQEEPTSQQDTDTTPQEEEATPSQDDTVSQDTETEKEVGGTEEVAQADDNTSNQQDTPVSDQETETKVEEAPTSDQQDAEVAKEESPATEDNVSSTEETPQADDTASQQDTPKDEATVADQEDTEVKEEVTKEESSDTVDNGDKQDTEVSPEHTTDQEDKQDTSDQQADPVTDEISDEVAPDTSVQTGADEAQESETAAQTETQESNEATQTEEAKQEEDSQAQSEETVTPVDGGAEEVKETDPVVDEQAGQNDGAVDQNTSDQPSEDKVEDTVAEQESNPTSDQEKEQEADTQPTDTNVDQSTPSDEQATEEKEPEATQPVDSEPSVDTPEEEVKQPDATEDNTAGTEEESASKEESTEPTSSEKVEESTNEVVDGDKKEEEVAEPISSEETNAGESDQAASEEKKEEDSTSNQDNVVSPSTDEDSSKQQDEVVSEEESPATGDDSKQQEEPTDTVSQDTEVKEESSDQQDSSDQQNDTVEDTPTEDEVVNTDETPKADDNTSQEEDNTPSQQDTSTADQQESTPSDQQDTSNQQDTPVSDQETETKVEEDTGKQQEDTVAEEPTDTPVSPDTDEAQQDGTATPTEPQSGEESVEEEKKEEESTIPSQDDVASSDTSDGSKQDETVAEEPKVEEEVTKEETSDTVEETEDPFDFITGTYPVTNVINLGNEVTIGIKVTTSPEGATYTWTKGSLDGTEVAESLSQNGYEINFSEAQLTDTGKYTLVVSNQGKQSTYTFELRVVSTTAEEEESGEPTQDTLSDDTHQIQVDRTNLEAVTEFADITIHAVVKPTGTSLQWYAKAEASDTWTLLEGETNSTLSIKALAKHRYGYKLRSTLDSGVYLDSDDCYITAFIPALVNFQSTGNSNSRSVVENTDVVLEFTPYLASTEDDAPNADYDISSVPPTYYWEFTDSEGVTNTIQNPTSQLVLSQVTTAQAGTYTLVATRLNRIFRSAAIVLTVVEEEVPVTFDITITPTGTNGNYHTRSVGGTFTLTAVVSNPTENIQYSWYVRKDRLGASEGVRVENQTTNKLHLTNLQTSDMGHYYVVVSDGKNTTDTLSNAQFLDVIESVDPLDNSDSDGESTVTTDTTTLPNRTSVFAQAVRVTLLNYADVMQPKKSITTSAGVTAQMTFYRTLLSVLNYRHSSNTSSETMREIDVYMDAMDTVVDFFARHIGDGGCLSVRYATRFLMSANTSEFSKDDAEAFMELVRVFTIMANPKDAMTFNLNQTKDVIGDGIVYTRLVSYFDRKVKSGLAASDEAMTF